MFPSRYQSAVNGIAAETAKEEKRDRAGGKRDGHEGLHPAFHLLVNAAII